MDGSKPGSPTGASFRPSPTQPASSKKDTTEKPKSSVSLDDSKLNKLSAHERLSSFKKKSQSFAVSLPRRIDLESQLGEGQLINVVVDGDDGGVDMRQFHERIDVALRLRTKYKPSMASLDVGPAELVSPRESNITIDLEDGVYQISSDDSASYGGWSTPSWSEFAEDVQTLRQIVSHSGCTRACSHRLGIMQEKSRMFFLLNAQMEEKHNLHKAGGVFASVTKVDVSVALSKSVDAQELLDYVVDSCTRQPDAPVKLRNGANSTLRELMQMHGVTDPDCLSVEGLGWQPRLNNGAGLVDSDHSSDQNPLGAELRFIFLSAFGSLSSRLLKRGFDRMQAAHQAAECAIPLYGSSASELATLAKSMQGSNMGPYPHVRWCLLARLMRLPPGNHKVTCQNLQDQLDNIFLPILKATVAPEAPENAAVAWLLEQVGAIQLEGLTDGAEKEFDPFAKPPEMVPHPSNLNSLYYLYYLHANLSVVNVLRRKYGMNTLQLRCTGNYRTGMDDVLAGYLLCDVIARATKLLDYPTLQYLCGLQGVGLTVSPLADHIDGATQFQKHPLANFLHRCLKVSIATEAPLLYHHNPNALVEEYATAQKTFRLSALDMTELARNSVVMSTFSQDTKRLWLGDRFNQGTNQFAVSQVTNVRLNFREESWQLERNMMRDLYLNWVSEQPAGLSRWHFLSNVRQAEYNTVLDHRVRFPRTVLSGPTNGSDGADTVSSTRSTTAASRVARALALRHKYIWGPPPPWENGSQRQSTQEGVEADFRRQTASFDEDEWTYAANDGVFIGYPKTAVHAWPRTLPTLDDYHRDLRELMAICASSEVKEFAHGRLENLDHKFRLHLALNHANEAGTTAERLSSNRDIYQATKIDTHIHMAAGMTPKQILDFVLKKFRGNGDDIAMKKGDEILTLGQLFAKAGITENLTVDQLSVQADHTLFERFDNFNNKYNPMENGDLRSLLLKTDNFMNGRYFAEIIHDVFNQYSRDQYTFAENRVSVYGINIKEWDNLATWFTTHGMANMHNKWIIQVPRVYKVFRGQNVIGSFGQYLQNIFQPLWEASLHPAEHPTVHNFLKHVSGFDSVDNEATIDLPFSTMSPWAWTAVENPPYNYYLYYLYANIRTLNEFRASRGFNTFSLRPHCGESGSGEHLYGAFLCANAIGHGINLRNDPPMQYLYYLAQIGLHVSPLSNNALFLRFLSNPFPDFFRRGLNVSLSTDDPMMFHQTQEPLIEEYSIAARVWGLSPNDLCEIARNSVLQCGFSSEFKRDAIGDKWYMSSSQGNDPLRTHLSDIRVAYRFETYHTEVQHLEQCCHHPVHRFMLTADDERDIDDQVLGPMEEEIVMSTHDQEMEVMLRDIEGMQDAAVTARTHIELLRRQEKSLVDNITEVGARRQEHLDELRRELNQETKLRYTRQPAESGTGATAVEPPFQSADDLTAERTLHWRPMPPNAQKHTKQMNFNAKKGRALPPL